MNFCQPVIIRNRVYGQYNFKILLSFDRFKNSNSHESRTEAQKSEISLFFHLCSVGVFGTTRLMNISGCNFNV